ncbi:hypothetical protein SPSYN_00546 [Sporotomaculum syntrophicum]|uniref:Uncharacterized protein n=1 Tax=Sporotomaculum syntrophicum TaxID=182264 RepID=A0A9D2WQK9_9FIRM|nr:hypothetical protein SPSYN_00546 [Sporotomaculum syntrophicum]
MLMLSAVVGVIGGHEKINIFFVKSISAGDAFFILPVSDAWKISI